MRPLTSTPNLEDKRDIVQNAIDLARILGIVTPKVAILSAVETVTPKLRSTLEAAALCKMADRGQITGGLVDGPLAFDNAVSDEAAKAKGIVSQVAGQADILVVPDLESGNMLAKQLEYLGRCADSRNRAGSDRTNRSQQSGGKRPMPDGLLRDRVVAGTPPG